MGSLTVNKEMSLLKLSHFLCTHNSVAVTIRRLVETLPEEEEEDYQAVIQGIQVFLSDRIFFLHPDQVKYALKSTSKKQFLHYF